MRPVLTEQKKCFGFVSSFPYNSVSCVRHQGRGKGRAPSTAAGHCRVGKVVLLVGQDSRLSLPLGHVQPFLISGLISFLIVCFSVHWFARLSVCLLACLEFVCMFVRSFAHSFACSFVRSFVCFLFESP